MGDTPTSPGKPEASPLQPFPGFPRSDVLACGGPSLVRHYALTEQVPLNLNTYQSFRRNRPQAGRLYNVNNMPNLHQAARLRAASTAAVSFPKA